MPRGRGRHPSLPSPPLFRMVMFNQRIQMFPSFMRMVLVPSEPPENVECRATSPRSLHVRWDPPPMGGRHGVIQGYKMQIEEGGTKLSDSASDTKVTPDRELIVHGLREWTNYSVVVRAFTSVGEGKESPPLFCRTDEDGESQGKRLILSKDRQSGLN